MIFKQVNTDVNHVIFLNGVWSRYQVETARSIGPYQLKHWISKFGFKSQVIDFCHLLSYEQIIMLLEKFISDGTIAVGISTTFLGAGAAKMNMVHLFIRTHFPTVQVISGGACTIGIGRLAPHFAGPAEDTLLSWLYAQNRLPAPKVKFDITTNDHRFDNSDCIFPDEVLPIELGRGCMFNCKFCNTPNKGKRKSTYQRNYQYVLDEIQWNKEQFGVTKYNFLDDTVNEDPVKLQNLAKIKEQLGFGIMWNGYVRPDLIWSNQKTAQYLLDSGMRTCYMGIETFNKEAGDAVRKGWASRHGKTFLPILHDDLFGKQVNLLCSFIIGLPGETNESMFDTFKWCENNDIGFHCMHPLAVLHGTELANEKHKSNMLSVNSQMFYNIIGDKNRVSSWSLFNYLGLGFDIDYIRMLSHAQLPKVEIKNRLDDFVNAYVQKLVAL